MNKHAYLIIANNRFEQLRFLLSLLDDPRNDIYLLIDKKTPLTQPDKQKLHACVKLTTLLILHDVKITWGTYSQIAAEMELFETASKNEKYDYYHLISGQDLPLRNQDYIHDFFDKHPDKIFLTIPCQEIYQKVRIPERVLYNHYFIRFYGKSSLNSATKKFFRGLEKLNFGIQKLVGTTKRRRNNLPSIKYASKYASNWVSLNDVAVRYIVSQKNFIHKTFRYAFLCDELFVPTVLLNNDRFKDTVYHPKPVHDRPDELQGNLRYINWWDGSPYVWTDEDWDKVEYGRDLGHLFSRKFELKVKNDFYYKIMKKHNYD